MKNLLNQIELRVPLTREEIKLVEEQFLTEELEPNTKVLEAGNRERYMYFLSSGIMRGFRNIDGKLVVEHLIDEQNFFTSIDSFTHETPSDENFETVTPCKLLKISKSNLDYLKKYSDKWNLIIESITNEHLNCKIDRVRDFQTLSAKERYLKLIKESPNLALNVSIENIASFLGMEPQSLSRIRKQITF